jgi:histidine kinase 2/3/4 (cytokinin receptor)
MDVVAVFVVDPGSGLQSYYNCSAVSASCAVALFDPAHRASEASKVAVSWEFGTQQFEVRCLPKHNLKLLALRAVIAWPLLMSLAVIFCSIIVYLVLKRMQAIEKDVAVMESMNEDLKMAKVAAEAADKAKSNFLATVSHEIRLAKALANVCKFFFFFFFLLHCFLRVIPNAACIYKYLGLIGFSVVCGAGLP